MEYFNFSKTQYYYIILVYVLLASSLFNDFIRREKENQIKIIIKSALFNETNNVKAIEDASFKTRFIQKIKF